MKIQNTASIISNSIAKKNAIVLSVAGCALAGISGAGIGLIKEKMQKKFFDSNSLDQSGLKNKHTSTPILLSASAIIGASCAGVKNIFVDVKDVEEGLTDEFLKCKKEIYTNNFNISDTIELQAKNKEIKDKFNALCDYCYNVGLKKTGIKNILLGATAGVALGIIGDFIYNKIKNGKK